MTMHVTIRNDAQTDFAAEIELFDVRPNGERKSATKIILQPGEETVLHQVYLTTSRMMEVREIPATPPQTDPKVGLVQRSI